MSTRRRGEKADKKCILRFENAYIFTRFALGYKPKKIKKCFQNSVIYVYGQVKEKRKPKEFSKTITL